MKNDIQIQHLFESIRKACLGHSGTYLTDESLRELIMLLRLIGGADRLSRFVPGAWHDGDFEQCVTILTGYIEARRKKEEIPPVLVPREEEVKEAKERKGKGSKKVITGPGPVPA